MKTTNEYDHMLGEFIERSAQIDKLVTKKPQTSEVTRELELLRAKQRETSQMLEKLEVPTRNIWENIGFGG